VLLDLLVNQEYCQKDIKYCSTILLTYRYFTTPYELLTFLIQRYRESHMCVQTQQKHIVHVIHKWIKLVWEDFVDNTQLFDQLFVFVKSYSSGMRNDILHELDTQIDIKRKHESQRHTPSNSANKNKNESGHSLLSRAKRVISTSSFKSTLKSAIFGVRSSVLAQQLTAIEQKLIFGVHPSEFLNNNVNDYHDLAPNLRKYVNHFNTISQWIATEILAVDNETDRAHIIKKFINVAKKCCFTFNNFNSAIEIHAALNSIAISRLDIWQKIPSKYTDVMQHLAQFFCPADNCKLYRNRYKAVVASSQSAVPYLALILRDLAVIEFTNESEIKDPVYHKPAVNLYKLRMVAGIVSEWMKLKNSYSESCNDEGLIQPFLSESNILNPDQLYEKSVTLQPISVDPSPNV